MKFERVAWVPDDDPKRDWDIAAGLAARWVDTRCVEDGASGVLVTNTLDHLHVPTLDDVEHRHAKTSPQASRDRVPRGAGPVLSYVLYAEQLHFAMRLAHGSSIGVVETISFPLAGWAAQLGAWDLARDEPTPPLSDALSDAVDRLSFYGNNGFGDPFGKDQARRILAGLGAARDVEDVLLGAVLAAGVSPLGVKNLRRIMGSADRRGRRTRLR